jgi:uncharacterized protein YdeI (YjbR/CyaY-like superfamily)
MVKSVAATTTAVPRAEYPVLLLASQAEWAEWVKANHASEPGVWLRFAKKAAPYETVKYAEALDVALCYGWIDGQLKRFDDHSYLIKFTPRGKKSIWSKVNVGHVERLIACGAMQPAGLAAVDAAKRDGRWDRAYSSSSKSAVPDDFQRAIDASPRAQTFFNTLKRDNRYAMLFRLETVVKAETRARRIAEFVAMLERGETIHPVKPA